MVVLTVDGLFCMARRRMRHGPLSFAVISEMHMAERCLNYRVVLGPETESVRVPRLVGRMGIPAASMTVLEVVADTVRIQTLLAVLGGAMVAGRLRPCGLRVARTAGPLGGRTKGTNIGRGDRNHRASLRSPASCARRMVAGGAAGVVHTAGEPAL